MTIVNILFPLWPPGHDLWWDISEIRPIYGQWCKCQVSDMPRSSLLYPAHIHAISRSYPDHAPAMFLPCSGYVPAIYRSYLDHISARFWPCFGHVLAMFWPCSGHVPFISRSYPDHSQAMFLPCSGHVPIISRPCPSHIQAMFIWLANALVKKF